VFALGRVALGASEPDEVVVLERLEPATGRAVAVARSYGGGGWEGASLVDPLFVSCPDLPCVVEELPAAAPDAPDTSYHVRRHGGAGVRLGPTARARSARALMQATFGGTDAGIDAHLSLDPAAGREAWLAAQMALPATLLRPYFRSMASPHIYDITKNNGVNLGDLAPALAGGARAPCEPGSEWLPYTLSADYVGSWLSVDAAGAMRFVGEAGPRPAEPMAPLDAEGRPRAAGEPLLLCAVEERVGGRVTLASIACSGGVGYTASNPAVALPPDAPLPATTARLGADAALVPIQAGYAGADDGVLVLRSPGAGLATNTRLCAPSAAAIGALRAIGLAAPNGSRAYRWDERTRLRSLPNEPSAPFAGPAAAGGLGTCPLVEPNFANKAGCRLAPACAPSPARAAARVERWLNHEALRAFWELGEAPVYRTRGQRLEGPYAEETPCSGARTTPWRAGRRGSPGWGWRRRGRRWGWLRG